jgi:DNA-binding NarL/FixJ family response regulator
MRCLRAGAAGFIPKTCSPGVMLGAVRLVMSGGIYLPSDLLLAQDLAQDMVAGGTPMPARQAGRSVRMQAAELGLSNRQAQVLALLVRGQSNKAIARSLDLAEQTVKAHVSAIFRALNVTGRTQALLAIAQLGLDLRSPTEPDMAFAKQPAITPGNR